MSPRTALRTAGSLLRSLGATSRSPADHASCLCLTSKDAAFRGLSKESKESAEARSQADASPSDASSPSGPSATTTADDVPGWLKGPQTKQKNALKEEWEKAVDPKTGQECWRSNVTGEFTVPGVPKPHTWHEVVDKKSGLLYYWCPATGEATVIGEPRPGPYGRGASYGTEQRPDRELDSASGKRQGGKGGKGGKEEEQEPLTMFSMYNNPLGYLLLGMAAFGILSNHVKMPWS